MLMPKGRTTGKMKSQAARMAAEGGDVAPVIPTTNMRPQGHMSAMNFKSPPGAGSAPLAGLGGQARGPQGVGQRAAPQSLPTAPIPAATLPVSMAATPPAPPPTPPASIPGDHRTDPNVDADQDLSGATHDILNQNYDTTSQEALIRQLMGQTAGQGQADLEGRMGTSGFGTSGALGAASFNLKSQAARQAAQQIFDLQNQMRNQKRADYQTGFGGTNLEHNIGQEDAQAQLAADAANSEQAPNPDTDGDGHVSPGEGATFASQAHEAALVASQGVNLITDPFGQPGSFGKPIEIDLHTVRSKVHQDRSMFDTGVKTWDGRETYVDANGRYYVVQR